MSINRHRRRQGRYAKQTHKLRNTAAGIVATFVTLGIVGSCADDPAATPCHGMDGDAIACAGVTETHPPYDAQLFEDGSWVLDADGIYDVGCVSGAPCDPYGKGK